MRRQTIFKSGMQARNNVLEQNLKKKRAQKFDFTSHNISRDCVTINFVSWLIFFAYNILLISRIVLDKNFEFL